MKKFLLLPAFAAILHFTSCGSEHSTEGNAEGKKTEETHNEGTPVAEVKYVCPMNCEGSGSDKPGKCPKCGMDLVEKSSMAAERKDSAAGQQEESHEGHGH